MISGGMSSGSGAAATGLGLGSDGAPSVPELSASSFATAPRLTRPRGGGNTGAPLTAGTCIVALAPRGTTGGGSSVTESVETVPNCTRRGATGGAPSSPVLFVKRRADNDRVQQA